MKVCVIGSGYVGLVAGAGFAEIGHLVDCVDIDAAKIKDLKAGIIPIYEPGLEQLCLTNQQDGRLRFSTDVAGGIKNAEIVFIAVGTPENEDGSADLSAVLAVAATIAKNINKFTVIACKSTVPVGTNEKVSNHIGSSAKQEFAVVSNPEFLREGEAVNDFMHPPRVVIGTDDPRAEKMMRNLYAPLFGYYDAQDKIICMDWRSAEMTKYTANAFLATRITFINEIANLCEKVGADVTKVRIGAGTDPRIGLHYIWPGCGYGGSCFPKDVQALLRTGRENDYELSILKSVDKANDKQKLIPFHKVQHHFGSNLNGKTIAIWGLAFKPETDDIRESPAIYIINELLQAGANVIAHDPIATTNFQRLVTDKPTFVKDKFETLQNADALIIVTDWKEYKETNLYRVSQELKGTLIVDARNIWHDQEPSENVTYMGIGISPRQ